KSGLVADPFLMPDLLQLAVEQELRLEALAGARLHLVDQFGAGSARHHDALTGLDRRAMAEIDIGAVAAIEPDRVHDRRAGIAERLDHAAHRRDRRDRAAD